jgi:hypothetical protein
VVRLAQIDAAGQSPDASEYLQSLRVSAIGDALWGGTFNDVCMWAAYFDWRRREFWLVRCFGHFFNKNLSPNSARSRINTEFAEGPPWCIETMCTESGIFFSFCDRRTVQ